LVVKDKKWEDQSDQQRIETLQTQLEEAHLAIKNLTHDLGRLAARQTNSENSLKDLAKTVEGIGAKRPKK
jgi:septal ring factor EnvC (AmiA/AmiB activator)